jgi:hypothetical protein
VDVELAMLQRLQQALLHGLKKFKPLTVCCVVTRAFQDCLLQAHSANL